jgi:hypothetical protein
VKGRSTRVKATQPEPPPALMGGRPPQPRRPPQRARLL